MPCTRPSRPSASRSGGSRSEVRFDPAIFRRAWERVLARHAILRTAFTTGPGSEPLQIVEKKVDLPWREEDLRGQPAEEAGGAHSSASRAGASARVRSFEGAASPPGSRPARRRPLRPSVDHAPPVHRRLVVADRVQGACARSTRRSARARSQSLPEGVPLRTLHPLALERTVSSEAFWKAELAGLRGVDASRSWPTRRRRRRARGRDSRAVACRDRTSCSRSLDSSK